MKIEIEAPEFEGFEPTGEYRRSKLGDYILGNGELIEWLTDFASESNYLIYRKVEEPEPEHRVFVKSHPDLPCGVCVEEIDGTTSWIEEVTETVTVTRKGEEASEVAELQQWICDTIEPIYGQGDGYPIDAKKALPVLVRTYQGLKKQLKEAYRENWPTRGQVAKCIEDGYLAEPLSHEAIAERVYDAIIFLFGEEEPRKGEE